jgi:hypothetical protein
MSDDLATPAEGRGLAGDARRKRRRRRLVGLGVPTVAAGLLAVMLEVPWYLVLGFCVLVAVAILFET